MGLDGCRLGYYKGDNVLLESLPTATCREQRKRRSLYQWGTTAMKTQGSATHSPRIRGGAILHRYLLLISILLTLFLLCEPVLAMGPTNGGAARYTIEGPGLIGISQPAHLIDLMDPVNLGAVAGATINLRANINMATFPLTLNAPDPINPAAAILGVQIGNSTTPFTGTFIGNGFVIRNLTITGDGDRIIPIRLPAILVPQVDNTDGLFGVVRRPLGVWPSTAISNLILESPLITGYATDVGGLVGRLEQGGVVQCCIYGPGQITASGTAVNQGVGGLVGYIDSTAVPGPATVWQCFTTCNVTGPTNVGGLVGRMDDGGGANLAFVLDSYAADHLVAGSGTPFPGLLTPPNIGGLVGLNNQGAIARCYADCLAPITVDSGVPGSTVGALVGNWVWNFFVPGVPNYCDGTDDIVAPPAQAVGAGSPPPALAVALASTAALQTPANYVGWGWGWGAVWSPPVLGIQRPKLLWRP
jgi:hypothetical protein